MLSLSSCSFPELPTLIKVSPSNISLEKLTQTFPTNSYTVAAVGKCYNTLVLFELMVVIFIFATETGEIFVQHKNSNKMSCYAAKDDGAASYIGM